MRIYAGLMPTRVAQSPEPSSREVILNHQSHNGPRGLFSVSGVKFTTARHVAERTLHEIYSEANTPAVGDNTERAEVGQRCSIVDGLGMLGESGIKQLPTVAQIARDEAVVHLDDLILRRCDWCGTHEQATAAARQIAAELSWSADRTADELARLTQKLACLAPAHDAANVGALP
jgi:glycerol-3-phosphate dehydrogenase